jgi:hypothetical protein
VTEKWPDVQIQVLAILPQKTLARSRPSVSACASPGRLIQLIASVALSLPSAAAASEHRSRSVAREFQHGHLCPSTGLTSGPCPGYWKDHIAPLACGGPDAA